jgi:predicted transcriptional regulator/DNA-binding XRE family transcriptional regulator
MSTADHKVFLGQKIRRLRRDLAMSQTQMAEDLGISASYLNLIEHNQRPVTVPLLLKLGQVFAVDLQDFAQDDDGALVDRLMGMAGDALFRTTPPSRADIKEMANSNPALAQHILTLYNAYKDTSQNLQQLAERLALGENSGGGTAHLPLEEVRDFFQNQHNHFPSLEDAADELWQKGGLEHDDLYRSLVDHLKTIHATRVKIMPVEVMGAMVRRHDRHARRILLSETLSPSGRVFQLACQIAVLTWDDRLRQLVDTAGFSNDEAKRLARLGLINYLAGAILMPYQRFFEAARQARYDIELLEHRFQASWEQICHRLTTLQRPGTQGVPFFIIRVDHAGNVSKRFSATPVHFARFGGACPRWNVYDAFRDPGRIHVQWGQMPDGAGYISVARAVTKPGLGYHTPPQHYAVTLGCSIDHAAEIIYADGIALDQHEAATPIGVNCRLCPRLDCAQRAFPPLNHRLQIDDHIRGASAFSFVPVGTLD